MFLLLILVVLPMRVWLMALVLSLLLVLGDTNIILPQLYFYISFHICRKENDIGSTLVLICRNIPNGLARSTLLFQADIFQKVHSELDVSTLILLTNYNLVYEMHHHHYCAYCYVFLSRYGMLPFSPFHAASSSTERQQNICLSFSLEKGDDVVHH